MDTEMLDENLEASVEASDVLSVPEGTKEFVDIIGDEKLDGYGNPASNFDTQQ
ncbi:hypothetical protein [Bacillus sp. 3255]|uniref:hypothetical protein n=1 Tax=Bacillus sp. 3255 TaxID=2817904 RepID=UPI002855973D|nr:hypothetical protein [Bacillus sp. 3255]MDR6879530.1 hypothetical protein [Bacillus sp. 3255]